MLKRKVKKLPKSNHICVSLTPHVTLMMNSKTSNKQKRKVIETFREIIPGLEKILNK